MIVHATPDELAAEPWQVTAGNAAALLRMASRMVDAATVTAVYAVDGTGRATDTRVGDALRDATCAQAAAWHALGIDPAKGAAGAPTATPVASKAIGSASISYDRSGAQIAAQARADAAGSLAPEAWHILAAAGLTAGRVAVHG